MKKLLIFTTMCFMIAIYTGCYYDKADQIYLPTTINCDTTNLKYGTDINAILNTYCNSCHGGNASLGGGIKLDTYASLLPYVNNGLLLNDIEQNPGFNAMPKGGAKLSDCVINKIAAWIKNTAPNN
jgi:hypothetical protein